MICFCQTSAGGSAAGARWNHLLTSLTSIQMGSGPDVGAQASGRPLERIDNELENLVAPPGLASGLMRQRTLSCRRAYSGSARFDEAARQISRWNG